LYVVDPIKRARLVVGRKTKEGDSMSVHKSFVKRIGFVAMGGILLGLAQLSAHAGNYLYLESASETRSLELHEISAQLLPGYSGETIKDEGYSLPDEKGESGRNPHVKWSLDLFLGSALNIRTPLSIHQSGEERIFLYARYQEKPLKESPYYAWRIAKWSQNQAWEFELIHHKLYLTNEIPEIQHFEVSHGYNLLTVNRAWEKANGSIIRVGAGIVLAHPESIIRGKKRPEKIFGQGLDGFYVSGPTVQAAIAKKFSMFRSLFFSVEGKFTASYAHVPIKDGNAYVPNLAFHGLLGFGFDF